MVRIDHEVIDDPRRPAQRHIVVPFHAAEGIADDLVFPLRDKNRHFRSLSLGDEECAVAFRQIGDGRDEAPGVESVMFRNKQRAETPDGDTVGGNRRPDRQE
jgi:hypothetical protein